MSFNALKNMLLGAMFYFTSRGRLETPLDGFSPNFNEESMYDEVYQSQHSAWLGGTEAHDGE